MIQDDQAGLSKDDVMAELFLAMQAERRRRRQRFVMAGVGIMAAFAVVGAVLPDDAANGGELSAADSCQAFTESDFPTQLRFLTDEADRAGSDRNATDLQGSVSYICGNGLDRKLGDVMAVALGETVANTASSGSGSAAGGSTTYPDQTRGDSAETVVQNFYANLLSATCGGDLEALKHAYYYSDSTGSISVSAKIRRGEKVCGYAASNVQEVGRTSNTLNVRFTDTYDGEPKNMVGEFRWSGSEWRNTLLAEA